MDHKHESKKLMKHYFKLIATNAGLDWTSDNDAEIDALVEYLITASVVKFEKWQKLHKEAVQ